MTSHELTFDEDIRLIDGDDADGYTIEAVVGTRFGNPVPVEATIASLLRDGSIVSKTGDENREMSLLVRITAPDGVALALGEKRLNLATGKRTTLAWTPPDGIGPTTVFDVLTSSLNRVENDWDLDEVRGVRTYSLRLICLPFGRSVDLVTDDAGTPPSGGGTQLYNAQSTTGWAPYGYAPSGGLYTVDTVVFSEGTGSIKSRFQTFDNYTPGVSVSRGADELSGVSWSTGAGGYLSARVKFQWTKTSLEVHVTTAAGRVRVPALIESSRDAQGFVLVAWPVAAGLTITAIDFAWQQSGPVIGSLGSNPHYVWYDDFRLLAAATTDNQVLKQLDVKGSARTSGSLRVAAPTDSVALGKVLAIVSATSELPPGFMPDGRRSAVTSSTTPDTSALQGSFYTPSTTIYDDGTDRPVFDVPVGSLTPGPYTIVSLVKAETVDTLVGVQARLRYGSSYVGPTSTAERTVPNLTIGDWHFVTVGTVNLPPLPMESADTTAKVRLLFKGAKLANVYMIPAWQVGGRPVAEFGIVDCGLGTVAPGGASSSVWFDSPSVAQPRGGYWRGPTADRMNVQSAWPDLKKPARFTFAPGGLSAWIVSLGAAGPTLTLAYFPAWFGSSAS